MLTNSQNEKENTFFHKKRLLLQTVFIKFISIRFFYFVTSNQASGAVSRLIFAKAEIASARVEKLAYDT